MKQKVADPDERNQRIWQVIASIPKGRVATYGQIAHLAELGNGARQVGRALGNLPGGSKLPWFRVINSQGKISLPEGPAYDRQVDLLAREGVTLVNGRINLKNYRWQP
ncbi:MAG: MGMT family protein [Pseudomonadales bacterium]